MTRTRAVASIALFATALAGVSAASAQPTGSTHFLVLGDWGAASTQQADVAKAMCASNAANPAKFVMTVGDNFYSPDGTANDGDYYRPMACLLAQGVKWRATWGNHDLGGSSTSTVLGSKKKYFTYTDGSTRVVALNGNDPTSSAQRAFLERTLRAAKEPVKIISVHQPLYTAGMHSPSYDARRMWEPLFKKYGVSLVLQGHNHHYERITAKGITYITTGGGGAGLYPCVRSQPGLAICTPVHHFLEVDSSPAGIAVRAVGTKGNTIDQVTVPIRTSATTTRP
jgi:acid phosphatase